MATTALTPEVVARIREYNRLATLADEAYRVGDYELDDDYTAEANRMLEGVTGEQLDAYTRTVLGSH